MSFVQWTNLLSGEISKLKGILWKDPNGETHVLQDLVRVDRLSIVNNCLILPLLRCVGVGVDGLDRMGWDATDRKQRRSDTFSGISTIVVFVVFVIISFRVLEWQDALPWSLLIKRGAGP